MDGDFDGRRQELHLLVDRLPPDQVMPALHYIRYLSISPVVLSLLSAAPDDESYAGEQQTRDVEAAVSIARGEGISHADVLGDFGLRPLERS